MVRVAPPTEAGSPEQARGDAQLCARACAAFALAAHELFALAKAGGAWRLVGGSGTTKSLDMLPKPATWADLAYATQSL